MEVESGAVETTAVFCCENEVHKGWWLGSVGEVPSHRLTELHVQWTKEGEEEGGGDEIVRREEGGGEEGGGER